MRSWVEVVIGVANMGKWEIAEPFAINEVYCDGVDHTVINGMMMAVGYRIMPCSGFGPPQRVAVIRLIIKVENVIDAIADAKEALKAPVVIAEEQRIGHH